MTISTTGQAAGFEFETALAELEALVEKMEQGDLTLEQSLKAFERGVVLSRQCQQSLASAEQRVNVLLEQQGQLSAAPFNPNQA